MYVREEWVIEKFNLKDTNYPARWFAKKMKETERAFEGRKNAGI